MSPNKVFKMEHFTEDLWMWAINLSAIAITFTNLLDVAKFFLLIVTILFTGYKFVRLLLSDLYKKKADRARDVLKEAEKEENKI